MSVVCCRQLRAPLPHEAQETRQTTVDPQPYSVNAYIQEIRSIVRYVYMYIKELFIHKRTKLLNVVTATN